MGAAAVLAVNVSSGAMGGDVSTETSALAAPEETVTSPRPSIITSTTEVAAESDPIPVLGDPPTLVELDGWLQSDIDSLADLRGKVVIVQFWTFGCYNCKNTLPHLQEIAADHADDEFEIVGVHSPEFTYEEDPEAIAAAAVDLGVTWPIALDTYQKNFFSWQGSPAYWPRTYVLDRDGFIRFDHIGEGAYDELAATVHALLDDA